MARLDAADGRICIRDIMQTFINNCSLGKNEMHNSWILIGGKAVESTQESSEMNVELAAEHLKVECANLKTREVQILLNVYPNSLDALELQGSSTFSAP